MTNNQKPFEKFSNWFEQAQNIPNIIEPTAMCIASVDENNRPSARMILLKKFDERGFCFFTNFNGRKASEILNNQNVALCFYWGALGKQVRIEGFAQEVSKEEADDYFASRRRGSQIGAWASKQSSKLENFSELEKRIEEFSKKFEGSEVPRPDFWSGFRVVPRRIEFWEEGEFRIHTREVYERPRQEAEDSEEKVWQVFNLYP